MTFNRKLPIPKEIKEMYEDAIKCTEEYLQIADKVKKLGSGLDTTELLSYDKVEQMLYKEVEPVFETAYGDWKNLLNNI